MQHMVLIIIIIIFIIYKAQYPNMLKALYNKIKTIYYVLKLILIIINTTVKLTFG